MAEVIGRNQLATRRRILDEYRKVQKQIAAKPELWRKLSFEAHEKICETTGDDIIDYPEFEFWFSRFARGNFELDYDRRADPKTRSFTDLPLDVFENVGEYLELEDREQVGATSSSGSTSCSPPGQQRIRRGKIIDDCYEARVTLKRGEGGRKEGSARLYSRRRKHGKQTCGARVASHSECLKPTRKIYWPFVEVSLKHLMDLLEAAQVELCYFSIFNDWPFGKFAHIEEYFNERYVINPNDPNQLHRHRIPGSEEFYEMELNRGMIRIERRIQ